MSSYSQEDPSGASDKRSSDDAVDSVEDYVVAEEIVQLDEGDVIRSIRDSVHQDSNENVLSRLATLSKTLSHLSQQEASGLTIDKEDFDLQRVLKYIKRGTRRQGYEDEKCTGVEVINVSVQGVDDTTSIVPTVGSAFAAPFTLVKNLVTGELAKQRKAGKKSNLKYILKDVSALVVPGEMCLVLGRPGAGCSSFLKTIAGETSEFVSTEGDISYDGISQQEMVEKFKKELVYNPELDVHFPHLTVDQTLRFAIACRTPRIRFDGLTRNEYIATIRDLWATVFGLTHTYNTKVGNDFIRGVSGGERKRVSIAEAMVTRAAVLCWDNATRGLDSSTSLEYAEALRSSTTLLNTVSLVTIYQAGENIYQLFDKVTVLYSGHQIYFGPVSEAKQYFINMGFECPSRQATAEFLTAITDPLGRTPRAGYENQVPRTAQEFEEYWRNSPEYQKMMQAIQERKEKVCTETTHKVLTDTMDKERMKGQKRYSRFTVNFFEQLRLCTVRGAQNIIGDKTYTLTMVLTAIAQALIVGSEFYNTPDTTSGAFGRGGLIFYCVLFFALLSLAEVTEKFKERVILLKQKGYSFYQPSANVLATVITDFPVKLLSTLAFCIVIYFLSNLKVDPGAFFSFVLFVNFNFYTMSALFHMVAAMCPTLAAANALSGIMMLACILYSSYMIQRPSMVPWFKWISYMNPVFYGFESLVTTDFHGRKMDCETLVPSGPGYEDVSSDNQVCAFTGSDGATSYVSGDSYVSQSFSYSFSHVWRNLGILVLFWVAFLTITCYLSDHVKQLKASGDRLKFIKTKDVEEQMAATNKQGSPDDAEATPVDAVSNEEYVDEVRSNSKKEVYASLGSSEVFMWRNIDFVIPYKGSERKLLDQVQGFVKPGTMTALMGESGAGKTTLLNVLSQRIDIGVITGDMLVNGHPIGPSFKRRTGYVQQQDVHIEELTVRESLQFAARLRRPATVPESEKLEYVEKVMDILQMQPYSNAIAGKTGDGLNVEQRKKLSIATEMVAKPSLLLFLDEPTSGLDSQSSWAIIQILRDLAKAGQAILCTIHQPSATLFEAFDRLLLLRKGGQTVYFGDIGHNSEIILNYFERNGARKCEVHENPAEYILEAIGAGATAKTEYDWFEVWSNSPEAATATQEIEKLILDKSQEPISDESENANSTFAMPYMYQFKCVLSRTGTQFYRDLNYIMSKFMLLLIGGLFIGFTFWQIKHTIVGTQNALFSTFIAIILSAPLSNQIQDRAISSREIYEVRESKSNTFHWSTLLLSQVINEIPYGIVFSTVFFICFYFPVQMSYGASVMGVWWLNYCLFFQLYYITLALFVIYFSPDLGSGNVILSFFLNFIISFCGVVQTVDLMPGFWTFMYKVSPYTYFIQSLVGTVLHNRPVHCGDDELAVLTPPSGQTCGEYLSTYVSNYGGYIYDESATDSCGFCQYKTGDQFVSNFGIKFSYRWRNIGFYCIYIIFNIAAMLIGYYLFRVYKGGLNPVPALKRVILKRK